jgi:hypothetical protein
MTVVGASWFPDGRRILLAGIESAGEKLRAFVMDSATGESKPLTESGIHSTGLVRSRAYVYVVGIVLSELFLVDGVR